MKTSRPGYWPAMVTPEVRAEETPEAVLDETRAVTVHLPGRRLWPSLLGVDPVE
jgi:hypothetical protein